MYDGELVHLAADYASLTETARQILREAMLKRGLGDPLKPETTQQTPGRLQFNRGTELDGKDASAFDAENGKAPLEFTWKTLLCECATSVHARQIVQTLDRAEIDSWILDPAQHFVSSAPDATYIRIMVAADQLEEARAVLAHPIPQDILEASQAEVPTFSTPECPKCGDPDPILLAAEPVNQWSCEACGKEWSEPEESSPI